MNKPIYLFFGDGGEYTLHPLYQHMQQQGFHCEEIDLKNSPDPCAEICRLKGENIVFLTSAHPFKSRRIKEQTYHTDLANTLTAIEIMRYLKPVKSVFYPHDLNDGMNNYDARWFSLFDLFLSPLPTNAHARRFCKEYAVVGWIKKEHTTPKLTGSIKAAHAFSETSYYYRNGMDLMYETFSPVWQQDVKVKMYNDWIADPLNQYLESKGISYYDPACNIYQLIDENQIVITDGGSSVNIEASLAGRMVINLLIPAYSEDQAKELLTGLPNAVALKPEDAAQLLSDIRSGKKPLLAGEEIMKPFDYSLAVKSIIQGVE